MMKYISNKSKKISPSSCGVLCMMCLKHLRKWLIYFLILLFNMFLIAFSVIRCVTSLLFRLFRESYFILRVSLRYLEN